MESNRLSTVDSISPAQLKKWREKLKQGYAAIKAPLTPDERAELAALLASVEATLKPAAPDEMREPLKDLALACKHGESTPEHRRAFTALFMQHIAEYPADVIRGAVDLWIKSEIFFPAISELRSKCELLVGERRAFRDFLLRVKHADQDRKQATPPKPGTVVLTYPHKRPPSATEIEDMWRTLEARGIPRPALKLVPKDEAPRRPPRYIEFSEEEREAALRRVSRL